MSRAGSPWEAVDEIAQLVVDRLRRDARG